LKILDQEKLILQLYIRKKNKKTGKLFNKNVDIKFYIKNKMRTYFLIKKNNINLKEETDVIHTYL
jgi:hypothetical protein